MSTILLFGSSSSVTGLKCLAKANYISDYDYIVTFCKIDVTQSNRIIELW